MRMQGFAADHVFDGETLLRNHVVIVSDGQIDRVCPQEDAGDCPVVTLGAGVLAPGFVDLQVNGGDGVQFNNAPTVQTVSRMAAAHARLGATTVLPTLITDSPETTRAAATAVVEALAQGVPGVAGLHLEGPHLAVARKGAHAAALIRPMSDADLTFYCDLANRLPVLKLTVAPETVTVDQIRALAAAGVFVSLGHSDACFDTARQAIAAGASCVTHLFNAMSPLTARAPGLVGAALDSDVVHAGVIADGVHVHPASLSAVLRAKRGPGQIFLVSDAMAVAGSHADRFTLNGREIRRVDGRLTLADGTLAGADLALDRAVRSCVAAGDTVAVALARATSFPAAVVGQASTSGALKPGRRADFNWLSPTLVLQATWQGGLRLMAGAAGGAA